MNVVETELISPEINGTFSQAPSVQISEAPYDEEEPSSEPDAPPPKCSKTNHNSSLAQSVVDQMNKKISKLVQARGVVSKYS